MTLYISAPPHKSWRGLQFTTAVMFTTSLNSNSWSSSSKNKSTLFFRNHLQEHTPPQKPPPLPCVHHRHSLVTRGQAKDLVARLVADQIVLYNCKKRDMASKTGRWSIHHHIVCGEEELHHHIAKPNTMYFSPRSLACATMFETSSRLDELEAHNSRSAAVTMPVIIHFTRSRSKEGWPAGRTILCSRMVGGRIT